MSERFALFDTAIGRCGIAWGDRGVVALQLPERTDPETETRLFRRCGAGACASVPSTEIQHAIDAIVALMLGEPRDLSGVQLDMRGVPELHQRVYAVARAIPVGQTLTYGDVAAQLGDASIARAVGQALGRNPFPIVVPCHRVLAASGKLGGFSATGGAETKRRMLIIEGALLQLEL